MNDALHELVPRQCRQMLCGNSLATMSPAEQQHAQVVVIYKCSYKPDELVE